MFKRLNLQMIPPKGISQSKEEYELNFKKYVSLQDNKIFKIAKITGVKLDGIVNHPENYTSIVIPAFKGIGDEICWRFKQVLFCRNMV